MDIGDTRVDNRGSNWSRRSFHMDILFSRDLFMIVSRILMDISLSCDVLMNICLCWDVLMHICLSRNILMNICLSSDILMNICLSSNILMNISLSNNCFLLWPGSPKGHGNY